MYIIGLETISPPTTIGRFTIECMPRMADCKKTVNKQYVKRLDINKRNTREASAG
jgi:hypothetical protein